MFPYTTEDLSAAERLVAAGCEVLMPWGAPIGSGRGLANPDALRTLRAYFPIIPLIIDAGIGTPSHAAEAMEMGYRRRAAQHGDRHGRRSGASMAAAFARAIEAGRLAYEAGPDASRATWRRRRRRSRARRSSTWHAS